jgi:glycosyltransferase involved in cell wall biosynthesis
MADSTNERRKGLHILSSAVSSLQDMPDLKLLVVGKSPATSPADQRTVYLDFVQNEELLSLTYSAADLFVIPSTQDNLPNTALEALSCGVPVVGSRAGGIPEIVRDNITGLLFENGDPQDLARAVRLLLASAARRLQMSESCRRTAVQEYDLLVQARRYESLYRELCTTSAT